jgi:hypothetical protein
MGLLPSAGGQYKKEVESLSEERKQGFFGGSGQNDGRRLCLLPARNR